MTQTLDEELTITDVVPYEDEDLVLLMSASNGVVWQDG